MNAAHHEYLLRLADNALILGQRLSEWCGHGPVLEEDLALANMALDLIGQARALFTLAGRIEGERRGEDQYAFLRAEGDYRNVTLVELPNTDFAHTVVRNLFYSAFHQALWPALRSSSDRELAAVAEKGVKESRYHFRHSADWTIRLGDGTTESHARAQSAVDYLCPYTAELFTPDAVDDDVAAAGVGPAWCTLEEEWTAAVVPVVQEATLRLAPRTGFCSRGKLGMHSEFMGHLLAEMQYLQRAYPGNRW
ncbi:MAG: phenylacetate-CoA oxygenase subunit PaaI [Proteobacteria bacterium]|nr:MAG: phenylacetate-CoA oxygenase subunit PaaI [Pseudomonadota bacterium]